MSRSQIKVKAVHYLFMLKFKDFSRTFKYAQVAFLRTNCRRKFTACAVELQYLMYISVMTVQLLCIKPVVQSIICT